jgi:hypothetical protein
MWRCKKCGNTFERLNICWGINCGHKVDIIDVFCPGDSEGKYCSGDNFEWLGTKEGKDEYWDKEWNDKFEEKV